MVDVKYTILNRMGSVLSSPKKNNSGMPTMNASQMAPIAPSMNAARSMNSAPSMNSAAPQAPTGTAAPIMGGRRSKKTRGKKNKKGKKTKGRKN